MAYRTQQHSLEVAYRTQQQRMAVAYRSQEHSLQVAHVAPGVQARPGHRYSPDPTAARVSNDYDAQKAVGAPGTLPPPRTQLTGGNPSTLLPT